MSNDRPLSPFSPQLEGFQVLLLAGAAGSASAGIVAALDEDDDAVVTMMDDSPGVSPSPLVELEA